MYPRRTIPFSTIAKGVDTTGAPFECAAMLHNISEGGILIRIARCIPEGSEMQIHLSPANPKDSPAGTRVSAMGKVLRVHQQPLDTCDVAVQFMPPLKPEQLSRQQSVKS